jgi:uridine kinase
MKKTNNRHLWWLGSRLTLIICFIPKMQDALFIPFLVKTSTHPLDPWTFWLATNSATDTFPYGPVMFAFLWPASIISKTLGNLMPLNVMLSNEILIAVTLLILDFFICQIVGAFKEKNRVWSYIAILAPLPLYISYVHGQLDIIPSFLVLVGSLYIRKNSWFKAGIFLGLAISAKFSFVLALPFFGLYFLFNRRKAQAARIFTVGLLPAGFLTLLPSLWSQGYREMVLRTPETLRSLDYSFDVGETQLLLLPIAYFALFLWFWNLGRVTPTLLISFQGVSLLTVASLQNSSVGWYYWGIFLVFMALKKSSTRTLILFLCWQIGVISYFLLQNQLILFRFWNDLYLSTNATFLALLFTANFIIGLTLGVKILDDSIKQDDIFRINKKPLAIAIAGDSGVGKDTLAVSLSKAFGQNYVTHLYGDDYHLHERGDTSWRTTTHLDPEANNLDEWSRNFRKTMKREVVFSRHYDHTVGRFSLPHITLPNDLVILNGLHAHLLPFSEDIDLKVFISMDEDLRFLLKSRRDLNIRGHQEENSVIQSMQDRKIQYENFVRPQQNDSHLLFHLSKITEDPLRFSIGIRTPNMSISREIYRVTNSVSSIPASLQRTGTGEIWVHVEASDLTSADNFAIFSNLIPNQEKLLTEDSIIDEGERGYMSIVCYIVLASQRLAKYGSS